MSFMKEKTRDILLILTLMILIIHAIIFLRQTNLQKRLTKIEEDSAIPNFPKLEVSLSHYSQFVGGKLYLHKQQICYPNNSDVFKLYFQNRGSRDTGKVSFFLISPYLEFEEGDYNPSEVYEINNLPSQKIESINVYFHGSENFCKSEEKDKIWVAVHSSCSLCKDKSESKFFTFDIS